MKLTMLFIAETPLARLYQYSGRQQWIPRSVCPHTTKLPAGAGEQQTHIVEVEDWWVEKNPWSEAKPPPQRELL